MMLCHKLIITLAAAFATPLMPVAQSIGDEPEIAAGETDDDEDSDRGARENPVIIPDEADDIDIPIPTFIKRNANHIIYNGADWSRLRNAFEHSKESPVSIVHIGDSHVQADITPARHANCCSMTSAMPAADSSLRSKSAAPISRATMCSRAATHGTPSS